MTAENAPSLHSGLAHALVREGLLDQETAESSLADANKAKSSFAQFLVEHDITDARSIAEIGSRYFGVPVLDLNCLDKEVVPIHLVSEKLILRHMTLPLFKRGDQLFVAMTDPSYQIALDEIKFHTGLKTKCIVVEADKLGKMIEDVLSDKQSAALDDVLDDSSLDALELSNDDDKQDDVGDVNDDAPIVRFVNKILLDAIKGNASDIHFEPYESSYRVRFRTDGILHEVASPPVSLGSRIAARLKIVSQLDISERRIPQDGRFKMNLSRKHAIDFRVSTCPTVNGEKIVMRILDPTSATIGVEMLGFNEIQKELFLKAIHEPQGMVLVTGPTGSGKTVTLYTALNMLNTKEKNISTAEDPVELKVPGINQVNVNPKTGLTFSSALRSFLRQDPDIIMVGEMRDLETAEIGIKAAQTGHMVLSTLHTNSAPETLSRLVNMGIEPYNIASSVSLIIAQRLARRLCDKCKEHVDVPNEALLSYGFDESELGDINIYQAVGCDYCTQGYKGRVGLYEVLNVSKRIGEIIMSGGNSQDILKAGVEEGLQTIKKSGLEKVKLGITSLEEINRVTKD